MVAPLTIDLEIFSQETFPLKAGIFEQPDAFEVIWNTGCLNSVQL